MSNRTVFLIDGFNVYYSVRDIEYYTGLKVKWLDYYSLCESYLSVIGGGAILKDIYYFSAYAFHLNDPDIIKRHRAYIKCLKDRGIKVQLSRFKKKRIKCTRCNRRFTGHEEKETDVAIASKMLELLAKDECDCVILVTGDTDLAPAVKTAKNLYEPKGKRIIFAFPYRRKMDELDRMAPGSFQIHDQIYMNYQLPDPYPLSDGTTITKPPDW